MSHIKTNLSETDKENVKKAVLARKTDVVFGLQAAKDQIHRLGGLQPPAWDVLMDDLYPGSIHEKLDDIAQRMFKQRKDAGQKHSKRQPIGWRSRKDVAADFDRAAFSIKGKRGKMGRCSPRKIMDWDRKYPDPDHLGPFGYHAQLHLDKKFMDDYKACLQKWYGHCADYKRQYEKWLTTHPRSPRSDFRFNKDERLDFERDIDEYC